MAWELPAGEDLWPEPILQGAQSAWSSTTASAGIEGSLASVVDVHSNKPCPVFSLQAKLSPLCCLLITIHLIKKSIYFTFSFCFFRFPAQLISSLPLCLTVVTTEPSLLFFHCTLLFRPVFQSPAGLLLGNSILKKGFWWSHRKCKNKQANALPERGNPPSPGCSSSGALGSHSVGSGGQQCRQENGFGISCSLPVTAFCPGLTQTGGDDKLLRAKITKCWELHQWH